MISVRPARMSVWGVLCVVMACIVLSASLGFAGTQSAREELPRRILVFFLGAEDQSADENFFRSGLQMVANYYGYLVEYRDAQERPLPGPEKMDAYAAVATTFYSGEMDDPDTFNEWLLTQSEAGRKLMVLGTLASAKPGAPQENPNTVERIFARLGLESKPGFTTVRSLLQYAYQDEHVMGFERSLPQPPVSYANINADPDTARTLVSVERTDKPGEAGTMVATGPGGSFASMEYLAWESPLTYNRQWYADPFAFFELSMMSSGEPLPAFVPAMRNGVRLAFSHVDGDAFFGFTNIKKGGSCAEIMLEEIFARYDLPFTVSIIVAELDPALKGNRDAMDLARKIFALPNVEPASHTYSHPYIWNPEEEVLDENYGRYAYTIPGYTFDPHKEIVYSAQWIEEKLTPPDKPCRILLWSGDCAPTAEQIDIADGAGLLHMNGGDTVYDATRESLFNVAPPYRYVDGSHQVHTGQANENILTNLWTQPFSGYRDIVETMKRTGSPRLLAPVNPYYHFYSAEKEASMAALHTVYDWVLSQELAHVYASEWIRAVRGFLSAKVFRPAPNQYVLNDYGECRTVRFGNDFPDPDLEASTGIIGFNRSSEGLFVFIDTAADSATVVLAESDRTLPYLQRASGRVEGFTTQAGAVSLAYRGNEPGFVELAGFEPECELGVSFGGDSPNTMTSDPEGVLRLEDVPAGNMEVRIQ